MAKASVGEAIIAFVAIFEGAADVGGAAFTWTGGGGTGAWTGGDGTGAWTGVYTGAWTGVDTGAWTGAIGFGSAALLVSLKSNSWGL